MIVVAEDVNKDVGCFERMCVLNMIQLGKSHEKDWMQCSNINLKVLNGFIWWNTIKVQYE